MSDRRLFSSDPVYHQQFEYIDKDNGVIRGVKICSEGMARGHGIFLNKQFVQDVVSNGVEHKPGIKARFGHPNMCSTALGTYIGRYHSFRLREEENTNFNEDDPKGYYHPDQGKDEMNPPGKPAKDGKRYHAVADLHLDKTAKDLPKLGNVWAYLINLAESSPDMFGNSIVFEEGVPIHHEWEDEQGVPQKRTDATLKKFIASDLVDSPAATDGLFEQFESDELALQVTQFLDDHPEVYRLAVEHPDIVETFMQRYTDYKQKKSETMSDEKITSKFEELKQWVTKNFTSKIAPKAEEAAGEAAEEAAAPDGQLELTATQIPEEVTARLTAFEAELSDAAAAEEKIAALQAAHDAEKAELEAKVTTYGERLKKLEGDLTKLNGKSTKVEGLEGLEDAGSVELSAEQKSLAIDLQNLRNELSVVHN